MVCHFALGRGGDGVEDVKVRLSVLWLVSTLEGLCMVVLEFYEPGVLDDISAGVKNGEVIGPAYLLALVIVFTVPLVVAFLSVSLRDRVNSGLNIIAGVASTLFSLFLMVGALESQSVLFIGYLVAAVFSALIVWYAYKWPKS